MNSHELALLAVHVLKVRSGRDVALLVRADTRMPIGWATAGPGGAARGASACVQAFRAQAEVGFPAADLLVYVTAKPTVMCLGMGIRAHASHFVFVENRAVRALRPADIGLASTAVASPYLPAAGFPWLAPFTPLEVRIAEAKRPFLEAAQTDDEEVVQLYANELVRAAPEAGRWLMEAWQRQLDIPAPPLFLGAAGQFDCGAPATLARHRLYMLLTSTLLEGTRRLGSPLLSGKNVACILVGPNGHILSWGVNNNADNTTRHAETNCILSLLADRTRAVPDGSTLYTTLESCEMCAGMLATVASRLTVVFGTRDPGVTDTALIRGLNHCRQQQYRGSSGNAMARANFRRAVNKVILRNRETHGRAVAEQERVQNFDPANPRPNPQAQPPGTNVGQVMRAHAQARQASSAPMEAAYRRLRLDPLAQVTQNLPRSITTALDQPEVAEAFSAYTREFFRYAADLLRRWRVQQQLAHAHPGNIHRLLAERGAPVDRREVEALLNCLQVIVAAAIVP